MIRALLVVVAVVGHGADVTVIIRGCTVVAGEFVMLHVNCIMQNAGN